MFKIKILISISIFSILLIGTSIIKNQTRVLEKKIYNLSKIVFLKEKDLKESQLDFFYLTSPSMIEQKIEGLDREEYVTMEYSKIFLSLTSFMDLKSKIVNQQNSHEKKYNKDKNHNINQNSFYFEDYFETNKKNKY